MKEFIKEIIEKSFDEKTGTNESIDDAAYYINALIETSCKRQRLITLIENKLYLPNKGCETLTLFEIIYFFFEYKRCRNIHEIINLKSRYDENYYNNIDLFLKN